ncbi:MAG: NAD(P)H-dependent oxidoreductase subunit E [Candidatus Promineifilaceae bacterium]|nr:NAD(P)H-dependent oxidoreductase subunit E [Candidatus Promineifilaceae bacterium]
MTSKRYPRTEEKPHPSGDERYKAIDRTMMRFGYEPDALLEVLNSAQESMGYLSEELLIYISRRLGVPLVQVFGVATFYHMFTFEPLGENNCIVCTGTACHVKGADQILRVLANDFDIAPGKTTTDGLFSLRSARCLGSCGLAPVVVVNGQVSGKATPDAVLKRVNDMVTVSKDKVKHQGELV